MTIRQLSKEEFDKFTSEYNIYSPYQTSYYAEAIKTENYTTMFIGLCDIDKIRCATLVLVKKIDKYYYGYCPRGFLIDYTNYELLKTFTKELKSYLGKKGICAIKICPPVIKNEYDSTLNIVNSNENFNLIHDNLKKLGYRHLGYNNYFEALKPRFEAIINLDYPYYKLFKNITKKFRTKIRSAENMGIRIHKTTNKSNIELLYNQSKNKYTRGIEYFKALYNNDNTSLYYAKLDNNYNLKVSQEKYVKQENVVNELNNKILASNNASKKILIEKKIVAEKLLQKYNDDLKLAININKNNEEIILSTILVVTNEDKVFMLMDTYNNRFKTMNAKHLLIWKLIEKYSKEGYKYFNLGGITNSKNINNKYLGLNNFKLSFNPHVYEYIGDYEFITNTPLYIMYLNSAPIKSILNNKKSSK